MAIKGKTAPRPFHDLITPPLMAKAVSLTRVDRETGCWPWMGDTNYSPGMNGRPYGRINLMDPNEPKRRIYAHRLYLVTRLGRDLLASDERPLACHTCNYPTCVNPHHTNAGSSAENTLQAIEDGLMYGYVPADRRLAVELWCKGMPPNEIAEWIGPSLQTIRSWLSCPENWPQGQLLAAPERAKLLMLAPALAARKIL